MTPPLLRPTLRGLLLLLLLRLSSGGALAQETFIYKVRGTDTLRLDRYRPTHPRADRAVVLHLHGGGFIFGSRNDSLSLLTCQALAQRGYTVLSADYRLLSRNMRIDTVPLHHILLHALRAFREATADAAAAVAFLCSHAQEWDVDTAKIILTGSSAGAITVLNLDHCRANASNWAAELPRNCHFAAVVAYAGAVYSYRRLNYQSPPAPTCLFHGTKDRLVNFNRVSLGRHHMTGANKLAPLFNANGWSYCLYRVEDHAHEVSRLLPQTLPQFDAFVETALANRKVQQEASCFNVDCYVPKVARRSVWKAMKP